MRKLRPGQRAWLGVTVLLLCACTLVTTLRCLSHSWEVSGGKKPRNQKCHHWRSRNMFSHCRGELHEDRWPLIGSFGIYFPRTFTEVVPVSWSRGSRDFCRFQSASGNWFTPSWTTTTGGQRVRQRHLLKEHFLDTVLVPQCHRCHFPMMHSDLGSCSTQHPLYPWTLQSSISTDSVTHQPPSFSCQVGEGMMLQTRVFQ